MPTQRGQEGEEGWLRGGGGEEEKEEEERGVQTTTFPESVPVASATPDPGGHQERCETGSGQPARRRIEWSCFDELRERKRGKKGEFFFLRSSL